MITVYSVKDFDRIVKNAVQWAIDQEIDRTDTKVAANMANRFKNSAKARKQPRSSDGRFVPAALLKDTYKSKPVGKPHTVEKNPLVSFYYPMSNTPWNSRKRLVRLISSTGSLPDPEGEIRIDFDESIVKLWLTKEDVLKLLERFD